MTRTQQALIAATAALATACSARQASDAGDAIVDASDVMLAQDVAQDIPPPPYDAGPAPACGVTALVRHVADRPGGDRIEPPAGLVRTASGFLAGYHHADMGPADGGVGPDAGRPYSDRMEVLSIAEDGTASAPRVVYDGTASGERLLGPVFLAAGSGAYAVFDATRGDPRDPAYDVQLHAGLIAASGVPSTAPVLRARYDVPAMATLASGHLFGVGFAFGAPLDGGILVARPVSISLAADGTELRAGDVDLSVVVPVAFSDPHLCAGDDGDAYYVFREGGRLGFTRFDPSGSPRGRGLFSVAGATLPRVEDAAVAGDGIVAVWSVDALPHASVHAVVVSTDGVLRGQLELDAFDNEGLTVASAVRAYGGVAVLWRRGVGSQARVRVAIVSPDGVLRVPATDLAATPGLDGRVVPWASGREIAFIARDGVAPAWGYVFGRACLAGM